MVGSLVGHILILFQERRKDHPREFGVDEAATIARAGGAYRAKQSTAPSGVEGVVIYQKLETSGKRWYYMG